MVAITGTGGATGAVERFSFDPFGKRRNANGTDDAGSYQAGNNITSAQPHRGYTGHEMLEEMGIVHMNGRLYDPRLGRVMSADPIVQAPAMSQSYNRYSYVMNGPLSLTDPSGFSWWTDFRDDFLKPAIAIGIAIYAPQISGYLWGAEFGAATACYAGVTATQVAIVQGATAGFLAGAVTGGTIESAFIGGISGAAFGSLHGIDGGAGKIIGHGMAGGIMASAQGGDFGSGFLASAFTQAASMGSLFGNPGEGTAMRAQNAIMAGIVGGTASVLGGGKFANGAVTGAMSRLLNDFALAPPMPGGAVGGGLGEILGGIGNRLIGILSLPFMLSGDAAIDQSRERINRYMSGDELEATKATGLARGGRDGITYATNDTYFTANDAQKMLALSTAPEYRVVFSVAAGTFSPPSVVAPAFGQPGGGTERIGVGVIPVNILDVSKLK